MPFPLQKLGVHNQFKQELNSEQREIMDKNFFDNLVASAARSPPSTQSELVQWEEEYLEFEVSQSLLFSLLSDPPLDP